MEDGPDGVRVRKGCVSEQDVEDLWRAFDQVFQLPLSLSSRCRSVPLAPCSYARARNTHTHTHTLVLVALFCSAGVSTMAACNWVTMCVCACVCACLVPHRALARARALRTGVRHGALRSSVPRERHLRGLHRSLLHRFDVAEPRDAPLGPERSAALQRTPRRSLQLPR